MNPRQHPEARRAERTTPGPTTGHAPHRPGRRVPPGSRISVLLVALLATSVALAGCTTGSQDQACRGKGQIEYATIAPTQAGTGPCTDYIDMGFDGHDWPDLTGHSITILDHGAFEWAFPEAEKVFEARTGADVRHVAADDTGSALQRAIEDHNVGGGSYDVIYGLDNVLLPRAAEEGILVPYTPLLADRVDEAYRFVPVQNGTWLGTPVDFGFIAVNVDPTAGLPIVTLDDVADHADKFVTPDPRFSTPGLGFLISTVAVYGEEGYLDYWTKLFENDVTVTSGWTEAYVDRFSGGYGQFESGTRSDKPMVTSYTTSPAYEVAMADNPTLNDVILQPGSVFRQIQTMAILEGADMPAAQAWIEFTLTDAFQELAAPYNAIYPVVTDDADVRGSVEDVYQGRDPPPDELVTAGFTTKELADNVDGWVEDWVALFEEHRAA